MAVYWISFRLEDDATYSERRDALYDVVSRRVKQWWVDTTSFIVADIETSIDSLASEFKKVATSKGDLVLIGMPGFKDGRITGGSFDQYILQLVPFIKKV